MKRKGNFLRRVLFKWLSFDSYLSLISKMYLISFDLGLLKKNRLYDYPYFLDKILKQGDTCIDIGANLGYLSIPMAKAVGTEGKVYSVEPVKPMLAVLRKNTKKFQNIEIYPYALGTENKSIKLGNNSVQKQGFIASGSHFVLDHNITDDENAEIEFNAEMKKGSELFANLNRLDFIKCDIEGYESIVIPELEQLILKFTPTVLLEARDQSRIDMLAFFEERRYKAFIIENEKLYPANKDQFWDILFIHEDKLDTVSKYIA